MNATVHQLPPPRRPLVDDAWLTTVELMEKLRVSRGFITARNREGMPHRKIGKGKGAKLLYRLGAVEPWLREQGFIEEQA